MHNELGSYVAVNTVYVLYFVGYFISRKQAKVGFYGGGGGGGGGVHGPLFTTLIPRLF